MSNKLEWGQTPWDNLSREELLREVQRMYAALNALYSCMNVQAAATDQASPYFGRSGSGGRALEMGRQVLEPLWDKFGNEEIYRAFFRYAVDLLFDDPKGFGIGFGWVMCPKCGTCYGTKMRDGDVGKLCKEVLRAGDCDGVLHKLNWDDMKPVQPNQAPE